MVGLLGNDNLDTPKEPAFELQLLVQMDGVGRSEGKTPVSPSL